MGQKKNQFESSIVFSESSVDDRIVILRYLIRALMSQLREVRRELRRLLEINKC